MTLRPLNRRLFLSATAAALAALPGPMSAQGFFGGGSARTADPLRALLRRLPVAFLGDAQAAPELGFGDIAAAARLPLAAPEAPAEFTAALPALRALPPGRLTTGLRDLGAGWPARIGFAPTAMRQVLTVDLPPLFATLIALSPETAAAVGPALEATGYARTTHSSGPAWAAGSDGRIDLAARDPDDPFRGDLGHPARVGLDGGLLRHASGWTAFDALTDAAAPVASDQPEIAALLDALDGSRHGALIRALILPDGSRLLDADPLAVLQGRAAPPSGRLRYGRVMLADFQSGPRTAAMLALTVAGGDAAALPGQVQALWQGPAGAGGGRSYAELSGAVPAVAVIAGPVPVLALTLERDPAPGAGGVPGNPAFEFLLRTLMMRDAGYLPR